jgi:arylsulfatase A-like enzyme
MTGLFPKSHGDRVYSDRMPMPQVPTLASSLADNGYHAVAVGKLHVYPQRDRIGFHEVILSEEGRIQFGVTDDYESWLVEQGFAGQAFTHAMSNNQYYTRPWHLPEHAHPTNWTTNQAMRQIKRRDPTKNLFLYVSYTQPHPPLVPLEIYQDMYTDLEPTAALPDNWSQDPPEPIKSLQRDLKGPLALYDAKDRLAAKKAFYALCTQIDHQIRLLIGTLREEGLLDETVIIFSSDHGDMLFNHDLVAKRVFYEEAARVPLLISGLPLAERAGQRDLRLACHEDIMPTILGLCGIATPDHVEGLDLLNGPARDKLFGEISEGFLATRMATDQRYKLIYYPFNNIRQLFDLENDPGENNNLADDPAYSHVLEELSLFLIDNLHSGDEKYVENGRLVGFTGEVPRPHSPISLAGQRGLH